MGATSAHVDYTDDHANRTDDPPSTTQTATRHFVWAYQANAPAPSDPTTITHTLEVNGSRSAALSATGYARSMSYIGVNDANYIRSETYNYATNQIDSRTDSIPIPVTKQDDFYFTQAAANADYEITASFPGKLECFSQVFSYYYGFDAQGNYLNYGMGTASTSDCVLDTVTLER